MDTFRVNATFEKDDVFHRVCYANLATSLINNHPDERGACVLAIDAPWGMGKTTFLHMWMNALDKLDKAFEPLDQPFVPKTHIYFNAWENDHLDHAFFALAYTICGDLFRQSEIVVQQKKTTCRWLPSLQQFVSACSGVLGFIATSIITGDTALAGQVSTFTSKGIQLFLDASSTPENRNAISRAYQDQLDAYEAFRNSLAGLAKDQACGKLYIFIDELDRCKPPFAIEVLEMIKHFFNVPGIVFVFGLDSEQLTHSIAGVYGQGIDAAGYLGKFFDHQIHIPMPRLEDLISYLGDKYNLTFNDDNVIHECIAMCNLTPRELPAIVKACHTLWASLGEDKEHISKKVYAMALLILLVGMRYKLPHTYRAFLSGNPSWDTERWETTHVELYSYLNTLQPIMRMRMRDMPTILVEKYNNANNSWMERDIALMFLEANDMFSNRKGYFASQLQTWIETVAA